MKVPRKDKITINRALLMLVFISVTFSSMSQAIYRSAKEAKGLNVGDTVHEFIALDDDNKIFRLSDALKKGPLVVIFYRGIWCPYCNKHLSNLQDSLQLMIDKGASVVAISPEKPEYLRQTADKTGAKFTLLYDEGYKIENLFDVTFRPDIVTRAVYNTFLGAKFSQAHSDNSDQLPIPATFIIGIDSKIIWRQFDPDFRIRSTVSDIVKKIPEYK